MKNRRESKAKIQAEVNEILTEIERISDTTKFNETPIFKGADKVNYASFVLTRPSAQISVLVECGYLIRQEEMEKLIDKKFQKLIAKAITKGCEEYLKETF